MKKKTIKLDADRFDGICGYVEELNESVKRKPLLEFNNMITESDPEEEPPTEEEIPTPEETPAEGGFGQDVNIAEPPVEQQAFPQEEPAVEVDITDMVDADQKIKASIDGIASKIDLIVSKFEELNQKTAEIEQNTNTKIEELEKEIIDRVPTTVEKQEMVSIKSPYSFRVGDVFKPNEDGSVDIVMPGSETSQEENLPTEEQPQQVSSDLGSVAAEYSERDVKKSFNPNYDEEDIRWNF